MASKWAGMACRRILASRTGRCHRGVVAAGRRGADLDAYQDRREATSRFFLASLILTDPVLEVLRRELRRLSPDTKVTVDELRASVTQEVLKREVVEGPKADQARRKVQRAAGRSLRASRSKDEGEAQAPASAAAGQPSPNAAEAAAAAPAPPPAAKPPEAKA